MTDLQIRCFLDVAKTLNFSSSARNLFISQSNISRQISMLEEELGFMLFNRTTKTVKLTAAGEIMSEKLNEMTLQWEETLLEAQRTVNKSEGRISIGCTPHIKTNSFLSQMLSDYRSKNKGVQIIKERNTQKKLIEGLLNGYYDAILIANHDVCRLKNVEALSLFESQVGIVLHKNFPCFGDEEISLSDLSGYDFIRYKPTDIPLEEDFLYQVCVYFGFEPRVKAEFEDFEEFLFAIESGEGVSLIYEEAEIMANENLRFIPIHEDCPAKFLPMKLTRKKTSKSDVLNDFFKFAAHYAIHHAI
ncbi:LysR family transcriptional regulator [Parasporobacterium paucivorans]|uniref:Regulatory helix-turn-helix protein, lysR family n=1 Tax=Parasporobacterium paucivorans DSM 15970 TaxID=1122934 RepID=A0A1M6E4V9_9FIRM|nr:LysR family transcriptional regulator [Parasporobacterium paucivorans]SHI80522.1 regulatory helix-turn-helix protein, lysR family [Parasporobacterium paucivorans DSM 15970]